MKIPLLLATVLVVTTGLSSEDYRSDDYRRFQLSLTPQVALFPRNTEIRGVSLNIWGENPQQGAAIGLVNGSTGESSGFSWGLVNYADSYRGVSWALVNYSKSEFTGWQGGILFLPCVVNVSQGKFSGFQEALVNYGEDFYGFQLGVVNYSENLHGLQVGLVNIAANNPWFKEFPDKLAPGFPFVNWSF